MALGLFLILIASTFFSCPIPCCMTWDDSTSIYGHWELTYMEYDVECRSTDNSFYQAGIGPDSLLEDMHIPGSILQKQGVSGWLWLDEDGSFGLEMTIPYHHDTLGYPPRILPLMEAGNCEIDTNQSTIDIAGHFYRIAGFYDLDRSYIPREMRILSFGSIETRRTLAVDTSGDQIPDHFVEGPVELRTKHVYEFSKDL